MKVLYVSSRPPYPKTGGREFMISQSLSFLISGADTHLACFHGRNECFDNEKIKSLDLLSLSYIPVPSMYSLFINIALRRSFSLQENLYYSKSIDKELKNLVNEIKPDVIVCDMLRTAQYFLDGPTPFVVDLDDILSIRYERMLERNSSHSSLGTYAERLPLFLKFVESGLRKMILKYEMIKVRYSECRAVNAAQRVILTSEKEAAIINVRMNTTKAIGISQAVKYENNNKKPPISQQMLFIGNMTTAQNIESLKFIVDEVLSRLGDKGIQYSLKVVGKFDMRAKKIIEGNAHVELLGFVEDLAGVVAESRLALALVAFGTGIKTKVLDSMSLGLPTVTNTVGAEGLGLVHGRHAVVKDEPAEIVNWIDDIFNNDRLAQGLVIHSYEYLSKNHSEKLLKSRYLDTVKSSVG